MIYFAIPGDFNSLTGGYAYDRRLLAELQRLAVPVQYHALPDDFSYANKTAITETDRWLNGLPDQATVLVDGLAYGVMDELAVKHRQRLNLCALCHHPLALETGLDPAKQALLQQSEQRALAAAKAVIVTSDRTARILAAQFAVPPARITVALPGTDQRGHAPCTGMPPQLLTVATLTRRKAHHLLITALAQLQHLQWQAVFVGGERFDPHWALQLQQQVQDLNLQQRIAFVGERSDVHPLYMAADIFVLPSLYEGYGMVFAEALSYGLPIVAADAGAVPDVVPSTAGLLVEAGSVDALRDALQRVLSDAELRQRLQNGSRAAGAQLPGWRQTALTVRETLMRASLR